MTDNEAKIFIAVITYNVCVLVAIVAITLLGALITGTMWGLWSLLLVLTFATASTGKDKDE